MEFKQYYSIVLQKGLCAKMMELGHVWESWLQSSISYMLWDRSFKSTWRKSSTSTQTFGIIVKFADWAMVMFQDASLPSSLTLLLSWAEYRAGHFPNCLNLFLGSKSLKLANATCTPYVENLLAKFQIRFKAFEVEGASCDLFLYPFFLRHRKTPPQRRSWSSSTYTATYDYPLGVFARHLQKPSQEQVQNPSRQYPETGITFVGAPMSVRRLSLWWLSKNRL